jgi:hypothetical protein
MKNFCIKYEEVTQNLEYTTTYFEIRDARVMEKGVDYLRSHLLWTALLLNSYIKVVC